MKGANLSYGMIVLFLILCSACRVSRFLPPGEKLYRGPEFKISKEPGVKSTIRSFKTQLNAIAVPKKNKLLFGLPYKVWWWYVIGETKRQKGFKYWLRNRLGEEPVLSNRVRIPYNAENMTAYLENDGYFRSKVVGEAVAKGSTMKAYYTVTVAHPYSISLVEWRIDSSRLSKDIAASDPKPSLLKKGEQFDLDNVNGERDRMDLYLKEKGYYYFNSNYIIAYCDTNHNNYTTALYLSIKQTAPMRAKVPHRINNIVVFPNYSLLQPPPDTSLANLKKIDGIFIRDTVKQFKPNVFTRTIIFRPGEMYSLSAQNKTLNRFINLGVFKFVKNRFEQAIDNDEADSLNVYYYLTPQKKKNLLADIGGFTKTNSFSGGQLNINWRNRNFLRGAENFNVKAYGAVEASLNDSLKKNNNWRLGTEISIVIPKFFVPFRISDFHSYPPKTRFLLGYEWLRRQALYSKNIFKFQYEINWKERVNKEHTVGPISISRTNTLNATREYFAQLAANPSLRFVNLPELISSSFYNYVGTSLLPNAADFYYFNFNAEIAGTVAGLTNHAGKAYSSKILGAYFAQYVKTYAEFRYHRRLSKDLYWANRAIIGIGFPYGNSSFIPFSKQFIIGGANSLRGFRPRAIGPGRTRATAAQQAYYLQVGGDYKLEMNTELRLPITKYIKTAIFIDAGNIWTKDTLLYGPLGKLSKDFLKELAFDAGVGLRFDASILVLRFDIGIPLRKPWLASTDRLVISNLNFGNAAWRRENLFYNLAIGYPF